MSFRLLPVLCCLVGVVMPLYAAADTSAAKPITTSIEITNIDCQQLVARLRTPLADGGLKEMVPDGIEAIIAIPSLNTLLIRGKDEQAINAMKVLMQKIDQPQKAVIFTMTMLLMPKETVRKFDQEVLKPGPALSNDDFTKAADLVCADPNVKRTRCRLICMQQNDCLADLHSLGQGFNAIRLRYLLVTPENAISATISEVLTVVPGDSDLPQMQTLWEKPLILQNGQTTLAARFAIPGKTDERLLVFLSATVTEARVEEPAHPCCTTTLPPLM